MTNNIVFLNVQQTLAPLPNTLQQTGAFVSYGGTSGAVNSLTLLTSSADLAPSIATPSALTSLTWSGGTVTAVTSAAHGLTSSQTYYLTIAGALPVGYNGVYACTITGTTGFTYALASTPGTETTPGTWASASNTELVAMNNTYWAQGQNASVYVLELGIQTAPGAITALQTYITNNPKTIYAFLVPRWFDSQSTFLTMLALYQGTSAESYFFITTTNATYTNYTNLQKAAYAAIEAPGVVKSSEYSVADDFYQVISQTPSGTNRISPFAFRFANGVTPYPLSGNGALFSAWKTNGVNWKGTGIEGGIPKAIVFWGTTMDVKPFNYWYSVDWVQINLELNFASAIINGSNNNINPLYLNQDGINRLQAVGFQTLTSGVIFGLIVGQVIQTQLAPAAFQAALDAGTFAGQCVINAIPFVAYYQANESDYAIGVYNGFSVTFAPLRGFESITINVNVTNFVA